MRKNLTYDDVILVPQYSEIRSRQDVDLSTYLHKSMKLPIVAAPMDTVCGPEMCHALGKVGAVGILHRYCSIEDQIVMFKKSPETSGVAIGATGDYFERLQELYLAGARFFCIDVAHGNHVLVKEALDQIHSRFAKLHLMTGNIGDFEGYRNLAEWGASSVRVGVGSGSCCTTQIKTGHGASTLGALLEIRVQNSSSNRDYEPKPRLIADGGIRTSGDAVKALAAGADLVMLGSVLAGTNESPGETILTGDGARKVFRGMASREAQEDWRGKVSVSEGVSTVILPKGPVAAVLEDFEGGLRSGLSYSGARTIRDLSMLGVFSERTINGAIEGRPHIEL